MRKRLWLLVGAGLVIVLSASLGGYLLFIRDTGLIPRQYRKGLDFTMYYPTRLPSGYEVDRTSFERKDSSIIFSIKAPKGKNIAVSLQAIPPGGAPQNTSSAPFEIAGEKTLNTAIGIAHITLWGTKYVSDIATSDGTWIILNVTSFTTQQAVEVTQSFTRIE